MDRREKKKCLLKRARNSMKITKLSIEGEIYIIILGF